MGGREIFPCPGCGSDIHDDMETCGADKCRSDVRAAAEAARIDSAWELVSNHLDLRSYLPGERARLEARFRAGAAEHGDDWMTWTTARFEAEIQQEQDDIILYRSMQRAALASRKWRPYGGAA